MRIFLKEIWYLLSWPYKTYRDKQQIKKRLAELRKKDPFIYK
jgi:hypothetical protein